MSSPIIHQGIFIDTHNQLAWYTLFLDWREICQPG
jgi:hypothetical protein